MTTLRGIVLPWQVGCEFVAAARKLKRQGFNEPRAWEALGKMRAMAERVLLPDVSDWDMARQLSERHSVSFWDGLLISCCVRNGVDVLYSEDAPGVPGLGGLRIINPLM